MPGNIAKLNFIYTVIIYIYVSHIRRLRNVISTLLLHTCFDKYKYTQRVYYSCNFSKEHEQFIIINSYRNFSIKC